jgi:riboflavin biosynthesis pyrimidine reductase
MSDALPALELLWEGHGLPGFELPAALHDAYGGGLGFAEPRVYANFVSTLDGTVALPEVEQPNKLISAGSDADLFVMGLLRACADAVIVGGGTLRGSRHALWTAERAFPAAAEQFAELRRTLGRPPRPQIAIVTASGAIQPDVPVLESGALVLTSERGAEALAGRLPSAASVLSLGGELTVEPRAVVDVLRERGHRLVLAEAGPNLFGAFVAAGLVDELFLTLSPLLAGRMLQDGRYSLVEGAKLLPDRTEPARLLSVRRDGAHLFLRYALPSSSG